MDKRDQIVLLEERYGAHAGSGGQKMKPTFAVDLAGGHVGPETRRPCLAPAESGRKEKKVGVGPTWDPSFFSLL